jgi:hypothetical protein
VHRESRGVKQQKAFSATAVAASERRANFLSRRHEQTFPLHRILNNSIQTWCRCVGWISRILSEYASCSRRIATNLPGCSLSNSAAGAHFEAVSRSITKKPCAELETAPRSLLVTCQLPDSFALLHVFDDTSIVHQVLTAASAISLR